MEKIIYKSCYVIFEDLRKQDKCLFIWDDLSGILIEVVG